MINHIWKNIKMLFSGLSKLVEFFAGIFGILSGCTALHFDVSGIDTLWKFILWFLAGFVTGFLLTLLVFFAIRLIYRFYFPNKNNLVFAPKFAEKDDESATKKLWSRGSGAIFTCYGDLFAIARHDTEYKKIVVIPVNTTFDTIVEDAGTQQQAPLVSPNTLHGMWIRNRSNYGLTLDDIQAQIEHSLPREKFVRTISREQKPRGNCREYDIGTIVAVEGTHNTIFLLAALSAFDEKNRAHAGEDDIITVIKSIVHYCDTYGQQAPVYLPVMGTGLSRTHLTKDQAFHVILDAIKSRENGVNERYTIVIYPGDREDISIEGAAE